MKIDWMVAGPAVLGGVILGALGGATIRSLPDRESHHNRMAAEMTAAIAPLSDRLAALEAAIAANSGATDQAALIERIEAIRADVDASLATREETQAMMLATLEERMAAAIGTPAAPVPAAPIADAPAPAAPEAGAEPAGTGPGETALFLDGQIRAFVSRVTEDSANVAVNGQDVAALALGEAVGVLVGDQHCAVGLEAVDQGTAILAASCANSPTEAAAAATDTPAAEGGIAMTKSEAIGVGQTALFADGKLRAFVSRINADSALISIGTDAMVEIAVSDTAHGPVGDQNCALTVVSIADDKVELSGGCAN